MNDKKCFRLRYALAVIGAAGLLLLIAPWAVQAIAAWQQDQLLLWLKCEAIGWLSPGLEWLGCACACG